MSHSLFGEKMKGFLALVGDRYLHNIYEATNFQDTYAKMSSMSPVQIPWYTLVSSQDLQYRSDRTINFEVGYPLRSTLAPKPELYWTS